MTPASPPAPSAPPEPMTPPGCDLRGMEWWPFFGDRFFTSELHLKAKPEAQLAAIRLWHEAWRQVPAASLPADDAAQRALAGYQRDARGWARVRKWALHGFVLCADGRLYHHLLAARARAAWDGRIDNRERQAAYKARKKQEKRAKDEGAVTVTSPSANGQVTTESQRERERERETLDSVELRSTAAPAGAAASPVPPDPSIPSPPPDAGSVFWQEQVARLQRIKARAAPTKPLPSEDSCRNLLGLLASGTRNDLVAMTAALVECELLDPPAANPKAWLFHRLGVARRSGGGGRHKRDLGPDYDRDLAAAAREADLRHSGAQGGGTILDGEAEELP